ncbi:MAG: tRNA (adenosine(37)-N6)-threonylcarbamoyltransferase complex dimerization subunit type 1 TsaB [Chloroflexota bacterium]
MLLAVDTSTAQIGLALYDGTQVPGEFVWHSGPHHTQELAPALDELLKRAEIKINAITAVGVALGPGSFTSLRVGLAFVKGLVLSRHVPVVGVPTLDVVAAGVPVSDRKLGAVVQAGRGRLAVGWYHAEANGWQAEGPATVTTAEELTSKIHKPVIICGELSASDRQRLARKFKNVTLSSPAQCVRRPGILAELAWQKWEAGKTDALASLAPIYLHVAGGLPA